MNSQITTAETTSSFQPGVAGIPVSEETTGEASRPVGTERKSKSQALCEQAINRLAEALEAGLEGRSGFGGGDLRIHGVLL